MCPCKSCGSVTPEPETRAASFVDRHDDQISIAPVTFSDLPYLLDVGSSYVEHPEYNELDVLAQRGTVAANHPGNKWLHLRQKELLQSFCFTANDRKDKTRIAKELVRMVHKRGGRVLRRNKQTRRWYEIAAKTSVVEKRAIDPVKAGIDLISEDAKKGLK